jgi:hypothetical protein
VKRQQEGKRRRRRRRGEVAQGKRDEWVLTVSPLGDLGVRWEGGGGGELKKDSRCRVKRDGEIDGS